MNNNSNSSLQAFRTETADAALARRSPRLRKRRPESASTIKTDDRAIKSTPTLARKKHRISKDYRASLRAVVENDVAVLESSAPTMTEEHEIILQLAHRWLQPHDLAFASMVCKRWNHCSDSFDWEQAARNVAPKESVKALEKALLRSSVTEKKNPTKTTQSQKTSQQEQKQKPNFQDIARGFALSDRGLPIPTESNVRNTAVTTGENRDESLSTLDNRILPKPKLEADDLFLLLELTYAKTTQVFCKSLKDLFSDHEQRPRQYRFPRLDFAKDALHTSTTFVQLHQGYDPPGEILNLQNVGFDILDETRATLSLWRRDTGQSLFFCSEAKKDTVFIWNDDGSVGFSGGWTGYGKMKAPTGESRSSDPAAQAVTKALCARKQIRHLNPMIEVSVKNMLVTKEDAGKGWRKELIQNGELRFEDWKDDETLLSNWKNEVWYLPDRVAVSFCFGTQEEQRANIESPDDFLLFVQGLDWK